MLPALSKCLCRARAEVFSGDYSEQIAWTLLSGKTGVTPPVARLSYRYDFNRKPEHWCLRADPVHLRADSSGLILFDSTALGMSSEENQALADCIAQHLAQDEFSLAAHPSSRWYLLGNKPQHLNCTPLPLVRGTRVSLSSLEGVDANAWRNRVNEVGMLLNTHPVNRQRLVNGQMPANSLWLWGEGEADTTPPLQYAGVVSEDPCVLGVAQEHGLRLCKPDTAEQLPACCPPGARLLVTLDHCRAAAAYEDFTGFVTRLTELENTWFRPLLQLLLTGRVGRLEILPVNGFCYRLTRASLLAFWRIRNDYRQLPGFLSERALRV